jgi:hypothetical protein
LLEEIWKDSTNFQHFDNHNFDKVVRNFGKPDDHMIFSTRYIWGFMPNFRKILERFLTFRLFNFLSDHGLLLRLVSWNSKLPSLFNEAFMYYVIKIWVFLTHPNCVLVEIGFYAFLRNQDVTVKLKSELFFYKILVFL